MRMIYPFNRTSMESKVVYIFLGIPVIQINQDLRKLRKEAIYFSQQVGYFSYLTP